MAATDGTLPQPRFSWVRSLFFRCCLILGLAVGGVLAVAEGINYAILVKKFRAVLFDRSREVTSLLAMQMGGAVKFQNTEALAEIVTRTLEAAGEDALGALVADKAGAVLFTTGMEGLDPPDALIEEAILTGSPQFSTEKALVVYPIRFADADAPVGAMVTHWTAERTMANLAQLQRQTLLLALGVLAFVLLASGIYLKRRMFDPIGTLRSAMQNVAGGDYEQSIEHTGRPDEIGQMARQLDSFRKALALAREGQIEMAFKGAALFGSSAALMLVDRSGMVLFANPACSALLRQVTDNAGAQDPSAAGFDLTSFAPIAPVLLHIEDQLSLHPDNTISEERILRINDQILRVQVNPVTDREGSWIGLVIEWNEETEIQRNAALMAALNEALIRVDFCTDGHIVDCNDRFRSIVGEPATGNWSLQTLFAGHLPEDISGEVFAREVFGGQHRSGSFAVTPPDGAASLQLEGSFAVAMDENGTPERLILLATDVTAQSRQIEADRREREETMAHQTRVVTLLGDALNRIAEGDLQVAFDADVPEGYAQLIEDFSATVDALRRAIAAVRHNSDSIRNETTEITTAAENLAQRTEKQAATLEETAAALDELTVSVQSAAEGADSASATSAEALTNAQQGGEVALQAVKAVGKIKASSEEISKITSMIDEIAFQTNLLALNAGVEAARAGDAGRGFAVVATEVRALARRSSDAASEINALITASGEQVRQGVELVDKTGKALSSIVAAVSDISTRVSNIATSAREQSAALAEINLAVNELDQVTQENAVMFQQTTAASHALNAEADALVKAVSRFRMTADAPRSGPSRPPVRFDMAVAGNNVLQPEVAPERDNWEGF